MSNVLVFKQPMSPLSHHDSNHNVFCSGSAELPDSHHHHHIRLFKCNHTHSSSRVNTRVPSYNKTLMHISSVQSFSMLQVIRRVNRNISTAYGQEMHYRLVVKERGTRDTILYVDLLYEFTVFSSRINQKLRTMILRRGGSASIFRP